MKPGISVLTLGVTDLERSVEFYSKGLGFATEGIVGQEFELGSVAFFELQNGLKLALWPRENIAKDTNLPDQDTSATGFTMGHNVSSKEEVDSVLQEAEAAGATIVKPAVDTFYGGYAGYFQDPDGHLWEIVWNPQF